MPLKEIHVKYLEFRCRHCVYCTDDLWFRNRMNQINTLRLPYCSASKKRKMMLWRDRKACPYFKMSTDFAIFYAKIKNGEIIIETHQNECVI